MGALFLAALCRSFFSCHVREVNSQFNVNLNFITLITTYDLRVVAHSNARANI